MKKKILIVLAIFFVLLITYFLLEKAFTSSKKRECSFCDQQVLNYQKYYEDDQVIGLYTYRPITEGRST